MGISFAFSLLGFISDASNFSNSSISAIRISSSQILPANELLLWSLSEFGRCLTNAPNSIIFVHFEISRLRVFWSILVTHPTFHFFNIGNQSLFVPNFTRDQTTFWKDTSFQIDGFLLWSLSAFRRCLTNAPNSIIFVHFEISRLRGSLGHLADSNSI